jgi:hypothetical protein
MKTQTTNKTKTTTTAKTKTNIGAKTAEEGKKRGRQRWHTRKHRSERRKRMGAPTWKPEVKRKKTTRKSRTIRASHLERSPPDGAVGASVDAQQRPLSRQGLGNPAASAVTSAPEAGAAARLTPDSFTRP